MAVAAGIAVATIYYNQPLVMIMQAEFGGAPSIALLPTATQLGYALGLFFLLPLGDILDRRKIIVRQLVLLAALLAVAAVAPSAWIILASGFLVGVAATVAQQIVPFAASLAAPNRRGRTIGLVMSGVLSGILLSRTVSGVVGEFGGWRLVFYGSVPLTLFAAVLMWAVLPADARAGGAGVAYPAALRSMLDLWRRHRRLRTATLTQAALFASFSAFWSVLALYLASPAFGLGADVAGLFGIIGLVGVCAAPVAGRIADHRGPDTVVWLGAALTVIGWGVFALAHGIAGLVVGVIVLDFGIQSALISNQHIIYAIDPATRSRLNTIFMTVMFLGGAAGAALAYGAWALAGWAGVCAIGSGLPIIALVLARTAHRRAARRTG
jgi:predicted MFS family arabinose efflux permease